MLKRTVCSTTITTMITFYTFREKDYSNCTITQVPNLKLFGKLKSALFNR